MRINKKLLQISIKKAIYAAVKLIELNLTFLNK